MYSDKHSEHVPVAFMSLHTSQTLICAMGKEAGLLRVSVVPLATSCMLTVTSLLIEERGSDRG